MKAKDVPIGEKVFVEVKRCEGSETAHGYHLVGFVMSTCDAKYTNFLKLDDASPVYPGLLKLCRKLADGFREFVAAPIYLPDSPRGKELTSALAEADEILGPEK